MKLPPDFEEDLQLAEAGDLFALGRMYGHAAAWLRDCKCPPAPLGAWIAARLTEVSTIAHAAELAGKAPHLPDDVARALRIQRTGKTGKRPSRMRDMKITRGDLEEAGYLPRAKRKRTIRP